MIVRAGPGPRPVQAHPLTATRLLWLAAGRPLVDWDLEPYAGRCWWCGMDSCGLGRPRRAQRLPRGARKVDPLPDTFTDDAWAACRDATHICEACAWTMSDWVNAPLSFAGPKVASLGAPDADEDGGLSARIGERPEKITAKPDGTGSLIVSPLARGSFSPVTLSPDALAARVTTKFRNWDHIGHAGDAPQWRIGKVVRQSDRDWMRDALLNPPPCEWVAVLGDGQKHGALKAAISHGEAPTQTVYLEGSGLVCYEPDELATLIASVEHLRCAGLHDETIASQRLIATPAQYPTVRAHGPAVRAALITNLALALALARRAKEIPDRVSIRPTPTRGSDPDRLTVALGSGLPVSLRPADVAPEPPRGIERGPAAPVEPLPVATVQPARPVRDGRQLSLFG